VLFDVLFENSRRSVADKYTIPATITTGCGVAEAKTEIEFPAKEGRNPKAQQVAISATRAEACMRRALISSAALILLLLCCVRVTARQTSHEGPAVAPKSGEAALLKVCLRLEDDSPFGGIMHVRLLPVEGEDISGAAGSDGETMFTGLQPGTYFLEASAPGFVTVRREVRIDTGHSLQTVFVTMKLLSLAAQLPATPDMSPRAAPVPASLTTAHLLPSPATTERAVSASWIPPSLDAAVPAVDPSVPCPLPDILKMAGERMTEFVASLEKFSATEEVEHFKIDASGRRGSPDVRSFDYVVLVSRNHWGLFQLDEYRNGSVDPAQFPAGIATVGLPAIALVFHPILASDFDFKCEGLGQSGGHPAWQIHFAQRPDRPSRIRQYIIQKNSYPIPIKGRAWIDPGTDQVVRLESELIKPIAEIALTNERLSIEYGPVEFHSNGQRLWLPEVAELYAERGTARYYRRHAFTNFKLFTVATAQSIQPKEAYVFTNTSDRDITGILTVFPVSGSTLQAVAITFTIPAGKTIFKSVGPGKDIRIPVDSLGSAAFSHNDPEGSVTVNAYLTNDSSVDVTANADISTDGRAPL